MENLSLIPSPTGAGALYAIDGQQWADIDQRVDSVIDAQQIADEIGQYVPNYTQLLSACEAWRSTTFPGLISQAALVAQLAVQSAGVLQQLAGDLTGLQPDDPVPSSVSFIITVQFGALAETAGKILGGVDGLTPQVDDFVAQNRTADAALAKIVASMPPGWGTLAGPLDALNGALSAVQGDWTAIDQQLTALSSGQITVTTAALLSSDITGAIDAWNALGRSATAFQSVASG